MFQIIFNSLRSGGNKNLYLLKQICNYMLQVCLSMYDLFLPPGLKLSRCFLACFEYQDNFIEIWIKFQFEEKQKGIIPIPRCISKEATLIYYEQFFF